MSIIIVKSELFNYNGKAPGISGAGTWESGGRATGQAVNNQEPSPSFGADTERHFSVDSLEISLDRSKEYVAAAPLSRKWPPRGGAVLFMSGVMGQVFDVTRLP